MTLIIQKYGETSVGSPERARGAANRVAKAHAEGHDMVVVVSAMSDETNRLVASTHEMQEHPNPRGLDVVLATGKQVTIGFLAMALKNIGVGARNYIGWQVALKTDTAHTKARIESIDDEKMHADLAKSRVVVVAGFQGVNSTGDISTLDRGGSDTSAVALTAALKTDRCQICADVGGVYTADPRVVPETRHLNTIILEKMPKLVSLGSEILRICSVEFAGKYKMRLRVLSSLREDGDGTLIAFEENDNVEKAAIAGIALDKNQAYTNVHDVSDKLGVTYQILDAVVNTNIEVDMAIQNVGSESTADFSSAVPHGDYRQTLDLLNGLKDNIGAIAIDDGDTVCKAFVVDMSIRSHAGVVTKIFHTLTKEGINIQMTSTSEVKILILTDGKYMELATRVLYKVFDLSK